MQAGGNPWITAELGNLVILKSGMAFLVSLLFFWIYFRIIKQAIYLYLAGVLFLHSILFAVLFNTDQPSVGALFIEIALITFFISILNSLAIILFDKINKKYVIIHDGVYIDISDGSVKYKVFLIASCVLMIVLGLIFKTPVEFMKTMIKGPAFWFFVLLITFLSAFISSRLLPMKSEHDVAILGEETPRLHLIDIFEISGDISGAELMLVPVILLTLGGFLIFLTKKNATAIDFGGVAILALIALSIVFQEFKKRSKTGKR